MSKGSRNVRYTIEEIKLITPQILGGYECISDKYTDNISKLTFKCRNGHLYSTSWTVFSLNRKGCQICKKTFSGIDKKGINRSYRNREWLYNQYVNELKSSKEIGSMCGVGHRLILSWLYKFDINTRSASESTAIGQFTGKNKNIFKVKLRNNEKICPKCETILDKNEFRANRTTRDGLQCLCKACLDGYGRYSDTNNEYRNYRNSVDVLTSINYRKYFYFINPLKLKRSFKDYQLDHIVSVKAGFENNISVEIISSPINLKLVSPKYNSEKRTRSDMRIEELISLHYLFKKELNL